ncbi:MAG: hypothetical protein HY744_09730 [Deltaproteobacteria bacterium]|nr:hypothetical protein [Deltaproteobacteria bacterium]
MAEASESATEQRPGEARTTGTASGEPAAPPADRVHTWPHLVRLEMMVALVVMAGLTLWSILVDAPLEQPASPTTTPNPSKAPWYFLGLQELLFYFDPWFAGVALPALIIVGLMLIPYLDVNPRGAGYYCWRDRRFAVGTFLFGFLGLWVAAILVGTFLRGPGWYFFWQPDGPGHQVRFKAARSQYLCQPSGCFSAQIVELK